MPGHSGGKGDHERMWLGVWPTADAAESVRGRDRVTVCGSVVASIQIRTALMDRAQRRRRTWL
jgi:hypothetical protein